MVKAQRFTFGRLHPEWCSKCTHHVETAVEVVRL